MNRYTAIESKCWRNKVTGRSASIYGALPWTSAAEKDNWQIETRGWTVRNDSDGTVGIGRQPWQTKEEADSWIQSKYDRIAEYRRIMFSDTPCCLCGGPLLRDSKVETCQNCREKQSRPRKRSKR